MVRLCHELANASSLETMFAAVVAALVETTGFSRASALAFDAAGVMRFRASRGLSDAYRSAVEGHSPWTVGERHARPVFVEDVDDRADLSALRGTLRNENIRALAFLPIVGGGRLLGKFMLYSERPVAWGDVDLEFALASADLLASFLLREEALERVLRSRRMESLGLLSGGIAHDFNNLLTAILGYVDLIRGETVRGTPAREFVDDLLRTVERASELTKQLLAFARPDQAQHEVVELGEFLAEVRPSLERLCGERRPLQVDLPHEPMAVVASRAQLHQLLLNLVANARDAMPMGGAVVLRLGPGRTDGVCSLSVTDTGTGMDEATRRRLFEPLFTTKLQEGGSGLGLATCYAIVAACGGDIDVRSAPGEGSTFVVTLPLAGLGQQPGARPAPAPVARVLLVEDQELVRSMLVRALVAMGFHVVTAVDGQQALGVLACHEVDVVVSDIVMPQLGGIELAKMVARQWPQVRVLLVTGFVDEPQGVPPGVPVLGKPFLPRELGQRIRALLPQRV